jgi:hypothetical protein
MTERPGMVDTGLLADTVLKFTGTMERLVPAVQVQADWSPLVEFVAVDQFSRTGTFLEVQDWRQYTEMLTHWAMATDSFETTVRRISEAAGLVFFEIEERHARGDNVHVVNSMTVFGFDDVGKIRHLDVYLQQPR